MHIVLSILEILGWTLLILLLILIVVLVFVLFCRFSYVIEGEWLEEKWARVKAHWLFRLVRAKISYADNVIDGVVYIFWKKITFSYDLTSSKEDDEENLFGADDALDEIEHELEQNILDAEIDNSREMSSKDEMDIGNEKSSETGDEKRTESEKVNTVLQEKKSDDEEIAGDEENSQNARQESIVSKIKGIIERIKKVYLKAKKILKDEKNKEAVNHLKKEIFYMVKIMLPKKSKIDLVFSTGSPDTTGQLFGVLACFPIMYQKGWKLIPDFQADDAYLKGTFWSKGWIRVYQLMGITLRIVFDKNCRRLYTIIDKFINWFKKDDKS